MDSIADLTKLYEGLTTGRHPLWSFLQDKWAKNRDYLAYLSCLNHSDRLKYFDYVLKHDERKTEHVCVQKFGGNFAFMNYMRARFKAGGPKTRSTDGRTKKLFFIEGAYQLKEELDELISLSGDGSTLVINVPNASRNAYLAYLTNLHREVLTPVDWYEKICNSVEHMREAIFSSNLSPETVGVYGYLNLISNWITRCRGNDDIVLCSRSLFPDQRGPTVEELFNSFSKVSMSKLNRKILEILRPITSYRLQPPKGGSVLDSKLELSLISPESGKRVWEILEEVPVIENIVITDKLLMNTIHEMKNCGLVVIRTNQDSFREFMVYTNLALFDYKMFISRSHNDLESSVTRYRKKYERN